MLIPCNRCVNILLEIMTTSDREGVFPVPSNFDQDTMLSWVAPPLFPEPTEAKGIGRSTPQHSGSLAAAHYGLRGVHGDPRGQGTVCPPGQPEEYINICKKIDPFVLTPLGRGRSN